MGPKIHAERQNHGEDSVALVARGHIAIMVLHIDTSGGEVIFIFLNSALLLGT